jgi:hypothetical protein
VPPYLGPHPDLLAQPLLRQEAGFPHFYLHKGAADQMLSVKYSLLYVSPFAIKFSFSNVFLPPFSALHHFAFYCLLIFGPMVWSRIPPQPSLGFLYLSEFQPPHSLLLHLFVPGPSCPHSLFPADYSFNASHFGVALYIFW